MEAITNLFDTSNNEIQLIISKMTSISANLDISWEKEGKEVNFINFKLDFILRKILFQQE